MCCSDALCLSFVFVLIWEIGTYHWYWKLKWQETASIIWKTPSSQHPQVSNSKHAVYSLWQKFEGNICELLEWPIHCWRIQKRAPHLLYSPIPNVQGVLIVTVCCAWQINMVPNIDKSIYFFLILQHFCFFPNERVLRFPHICLSKSFSSSWMLLKTCHRAFSSNSLQAPNTNNGYSVIIFSTFEGYSDL